MIFDILADELPIVVAGFWQQDEGAIGGGGGDENVGSIEINFNHLVIVEVGDGSGDGFERCFVKVSANGFSYLSEKGRSVLEGFDRNQFFE